MKFNWKLRFKNKATLVAILLAVVTFIYQVLGIIGITAPISQDQVMQIIGLIINVLVGLGVVVDPTTAGIKDSDQAMTYTEPKVSGGAE